MVKVVEVGKNCEKKCIQVDKRIKVAKHTNRFKMKWWMKVVTIGQKLHKKSIQIENPVMTRTIYIYITNTTGNISLYFSSI